MSESNGEARALRVMVDELRAEEPRELAWDAIESRLMAEIARRARAGDERRARSSAGSPLVRVFAFAAAAAGLVLGGFALSSGERFGANEPAPRAVDAASAPLSPGEAGARGERDLLSLRVGDVIEAAGSPLTFGRDGAVSWTLAPGGRVVVRSVGAGGVGHTVALERGSIRAEVTPRDPSEGLVEAFAVEVENTRVAVHGTSFTVVHDGDRVIVDVEHGSVAVGPRGHVGVTTGHLLVGPRRASFSLDGGRLARLLPRPATDRAAVAVAAVERPQVAQIDPSASPAPALPAPQPEVHPVSAGSPVGGPEPPPHAAAPKVASPEPPPPPAAPPPPPPPPLTAASVRALLSQCFERTYGAGASTPDVSVNSTLRLVFQGDGLLRSGRFDPPLRPDFQGCVGGAIAGRSGEPGGSLDVPFSMKR